ncbi:hypothetical protein JOJ88_003641 [Pantoea cypripedii]|nr:hypothetical protein [Pantoea cypripedii]
MARFIAWRHSPRAGFVRFWLRQFQFAGAATEQRAPWAAPFAFPGPAPPSSPLRDSFAYSRFRRTGVDSLLLNAAFRRILAAHPGIVPALSESGWRSHPRCNSHAGLCFFLCCLFCLFSFFCGFSGGGVGGIRSAECRVKARTRRMDAARARHEPGRRIRAVRQA